MWIYLHTNMAMKHHNYSRLVGFMKIALPLVALGVLGTVFLITTDDGFDPGFTFSQAEFDALERGNFLANPRINGKTENGDIFSLIADSIAPQSSDLKLIFAVNLTSNFDFASGEQAEIIAESAIIDMVEQLLIFDTGADISTSDGYEGTVKTLTADLQTGNIYGTMIVTDGPLGHISADLFRISNVVTGSDENRVLSFEKSVKVTLNRAE